MVINHLLTGMILQVPPHPPKKKISTWNKQPFFSGCVNWMIPNLYLGNGCFTNHPFKTDCLEYQAKKFFFVDVIWLFQSFFWAGGCKGEHHIHMSSPFF